jgi:hypothetical protein
MTDYSLMNKQLLSLTEGVEDGISNLANASALLFHTLEGLNWAGFYLYKEGALLLAFHCGVESEGQQFDYYFIASFTDDPYFAYALTNGVVNDYYTPFPEGFNGGTIDDGKSFEISDINPILMSGEHLFLGIENGEYGESKVQYEPDNYYTIVANEDGDGYHFSLVSSGNN